jgi:4-diphosphocytidyl-2-C-methyl-D-erythritol kinase
MLVCKEQFETIGGGLLVRAPAKINLSLLIAGKRPDGYHEIDTIMAKINFYDEIFIEKSIGLRLAPPRRERAAGIEFVCNGPQWAPEGQDNLVYKAAELLLENTGRAYSAEAAAKAGKADIKITLTKNIPAGSGLGSASSDAAATLIGLNKYLDLRLPDGRLAELAPQLGSDVAFFLGGPLAHCSGKGEKIKKIYKKFGFLALLVLPNVSVSTKRVYEKYQHDSGLYNNLNVRINSYLQKNRIDLVLKLCANMLQNSCFGLHNELAELKDKIESSGFAPCCLSGSGSAMFYVMDVDEGKAEQNRLKLEKETGCGTLIVGNNSW